MMDGDGYLIGVFLIWILSLRKSSPLNLHLENTMGKWLGLFATKTTRK